MLNIALPLAEIEFSFTRSSGPGGQNVNKVNSKAVLRWHVAASSFLPSGVHARFLARYGSSLTQAGELVLTSDRFRDQGRNREDALEKLRQMIATVWHPPKLRRKTKPTRSSREKHKQHKRRHSDKKRSRGRVVVS